MRDAGEDAYNMDDRDDLHAQAQAGNTALQALIAKIGELIAASRALLARLQGRNEEPPPDAEP